MRFLTDKDILEFINTHDYDVRKTGNARWIDQKCTADVICIISDCVLNYYQENGDVEFTSRDIWYSKYLSLVNLHHYLKRLLGKLHHLSIHISPIDIVLTRI